MPPGLPLLARVLKRRALGERLAVLPGELGDGPVRRGTEVGRVDEEALLATLQLQGEFRDRGVGDRFESGPQAAVDGVHAAADVDFDRQ